MRNVSWDTRECFRAPLPRERPRSSGACLFIEPRVRPTAKSSSQSNDCSPIRSDPGVERCRAERLAGSAVWASIHGFNPGKGSRAVAAPKIRQRCGPCQARSTSYAMENSSSCYVQSRSARRPRWSSSPTGLPSPVNNADTLRWARRREATTLGSTVGSDHRAKARTPTTTHAITAATLTAMAIRALRAVCSCTSVSA